MQHSLSEQEYQAEMVEPTVEEWSDIQLLLDTSSTDSLVISTFRQVLESNQEHPVTIAR